MRRGGAARLLLERIIDGFLIPEGPSKSTLQHCGCVIAQPPALIANVVLHGAINSVNKQLIVSVLVLILIEQ